MEDLDLRYDDVQKEIVDGVPTMDFSERLYAHIEESMATTLVVKLLGRKIGYTALWNKACSLWKLMRRFHLMDIDNDYYLARFESVSDYNNVLSNGPWVIFGRYLTVQPWSSSFSSLDSFPQSVVTLVRISRLPKSFYKRTLF